MFSGVQSLRRFGSAGEGIVAAMVSQGSPQVLWDAIKVWNSS